MDKLKLAAILAGSLILLSGIGHTAQRSGPKLQVVWQETMGGSRVYIFGLPDCEHPTVTPASEVGGPLELRCGK